jgi:UDP-N-acetylmuramate dehydrogenase
MQDLNNSLIKLNEPLSKHCSYNTGGPARYFAAPKNIKDLMAVWQFIVSNSIKYQFIGNGSNVLFDDRGFDGIIVTLKNLNRYCIADGEYVMAGAGMMLDEVVEFSLFTGLGGMEDLSGIPGTIGGAVFMNAGAFEREMKDIVEKVSVFEEGRGFALYSKEAGFAYRKSNLEGKIVLETVLRLKKSSIDAMIRRQTILDKRKSKQPLEYPSCGSVFKRPEEGYAGKLIEDCNLKGFAIGGAKVSEKHANFIVNFNSATSSDIKELIYYVKKVVYEKTGIMLEEEVKIIDF